MHYLCFIVFWELAYFCTLDDSCFSTKYNEIQDKYVYRQDSYMYEQRKGLKKKLMRKGQLIFKNILKYETDKLKTKLTDSSA